MQESFGPSKTRTNFANNGAITKKQNMLQKIGQQLLSSKHTLTFGQFMHLAPNLKQYVVSRISSNSQPTHLQGPPFYVGLVAIFLHKAKTH